MANVLVTGATGFIGLHLVEALLRRGDGVRCLVRSASNVSALRELGIDLVSAEYDQPRTLEAAASGAEVVYHLAGITRSFASQQFHQVNGEGTARLAQACAAQPRPPHLIFVSSVAAAGPAPRGQVRVEADPPTPVSHYGRSKLAGERAAGRLAADLPLTIIRPGVVFGPRDPAFVKILRTIRRLCLHPSPGFFPPALSYIHVEDLVDLLLRAQHSGSRVPADPQGKPGQGRYFAVTSEYPTYAQLGRIVRPMLARPLAPVLPLAGPVAWCVAAASECISRLSGQPEELSFDKIREALATSWACSGAAARRDLGFEPARPLAERLKETIDWYLKAGWL
jgi:nucleoside-diphosphate-sugar epimerase